MLLDESALQHPHALRSEKLSTNAVHTAWFNHLSSYCVGIGYRPPGRACLLFTAVLVAGSVARREVELWYRCNSDSSWRSHVLAAEVWEPAKEIPVAVAGGLIGHNAGIQTFYNLYLAHPVHLLSRLTPVVKLSSASTFPKCVSRVRSRHSSSASPTSELSPGSLIRPASMQPHAFNPTPSNESSLRSTSPLPPILNRTLDQKCERASDGNRRATMFRARLLATCTPSIS